MFLLDCVSTYSKSIWMEKAVTLSRRFHQLLRQIFSSDSILQLVCTKAIEPLTHYGQGLPLDDTLGALIPAFGMIFRNLDQGLPVTMAVEGRMRKLASLLARRARTVFDSLVRTREVVHQVALPQSMEEEARNWQTMGSYYGRDPRRVRPFYEGRDIAKSGNMVDEGSCRKLYSTYSKQNLTGGLMALWCPHLVCLGFHKMPRAEGRNDVFSALFKYWDVAPKVVIYDFACQLGPYCMSREPEFFKDTLFVVDEMHANGHSNCSQACFVSNYMQVRPSLMSINTSAAECSNAGLNRIRKSVSYMNQAHAILFTYLYLCVWNRRREHLFKTEGDKRLREYELARPYSTHDDED